MTDQPSRDDVLALTTEIVSAYLSNNCHSRQRNSRPIIEQVFKHALEREQRRRRDGRPSATGGADQEIGEPGLHRLSRRRQEAQDAEALSEDGVQHDARTIPRALGPAFGLPDGRAQLRASAFVSWRRISASVQEADNLSLRATSEAIQKRMDCFVGFTASSQ
jgi:hypothetical protein